MLIEEEKKIQIEQSQTVPALLVSCKTDEVQQSHSMSRNMAHLEERERSDREKRAIHKGQTEVNDI
jgi:hypothetical protein